METNTRWSIKPNPLQEDVTRLSTELKVAPLIGQLLVQRGITSYKEAQQFFRPQLSDLHDPFLMQDMDKAVARIQKAIRNGENILIYGDYDVDGTTAVAMVYTYLVQEYANVATYIPDRYNEGYGVSFKGIDFASDNNIRLIIALDCGIKALEEVAYAQQKGIDFIICDHHLPGKTLPEAVAVLDPKRDDCKYPYKELCGCGVGFKLLQALAGSDSHPGQSLMPYLDLVAIAIAADIVPITGENRVLAFYGLKVINGSPRAGIQAITHEIKKKQLTITDVVFIIAPRINAAGRMKHGQYAVQLLTATTLEEARGYATAIEQFNTDRKGLDREITDRALQQIKENREERNFTSVVYDEKWHKGVIGIVASRLTETHYRPTLVFTKSGDKLAASARSVKGFDVYKALEGCSAFIEQFGGHKYAAGLTLRPERYEDFKQQFEQVVANTIDPKLLVPEIRIDAEITLGQITPKLLRILKQFAPFGPGNMTPVFLARHVQDTGYARGVGEEEKHLKLTLTQKGSLPIGAIGFNLGGKLSRTTNNSTFDCVFSLDENEWNGQTSLQLKIRDLR
ncbi:MAG: single-stranded-DNA-specific exonuclease RecJ [Bacteroidota bacterium]